MNRKVNGAYVGVIVFFFLFLLYIGNTFSVQKETQRIPVKYERIEDFERTEVKAGEEGVLQDTVVYTLELPEELEGRSTLAIYSVHQNLHVFIADEEVYTLQWIEGENAFGKTPGIHWNFITIGEKDCGETAYIYVTSPYPDTLQLSPEFYIGDKEALCIGIIRQELPEYVVDILLFIVGMILIAFWLWAYRGAKRGGSMLYLGIFAMVLAVWLGNDLHSTALIFFSPLVSVYLSFLSLMLMPIPFLMYAREMFYDKKDKSWYITCIISFLQIAVSIVLQVLNIRDLRETLFLIHGMLGIIFALVIYHIIKEIRAIGFSTKIKINLIGMGCCAAAAVADVVIYYLNRNKATQVLCALTFLIYIIVLGVMAMKETYGVLQLGKMAKKYQNMAYRDQMTGLYNRTAFEEMMNDTVVKTSGATVVMFDLNDLKKCNDVYGHAAGDSYIMQSAKIIGDVFESVGTCYRIGGDEFCTIIPEEKKQYCERALEDLQKKVDEANRLKSECKIHIAYGYATFDENLDKELNDTRSRADANMYHMKFAMKEKENR